MGLAERLAGSFFGGEAPPSAVLVGLSWRGAELTVLGYDRVSTLRGEWQAAEAAASVSRLLRFGPFGRAVAIDAVFLVAPPDADRSSLPLGGDLRVLAGMTLEIEVSVALSEVAGGG